MLYGMTGGNHFELLEFEFGIMRPPSVWENELGMKRVRQPEGADSMGMTGG